MITDINSLSFCTDHQVCIDSTLAVLTFYSDFTLSLQVLFILHGATPLRACVSATCVQARRNPRLWIAPTIFTDMLWAMNLILKNLWSYESHHEAACGLCVCSSQVHVCVCVCQCVHGIFHTHECGGHSKFRVQQLPLKCPRCMSHNLHKMFNIAMYCNIITCDLGHLLAETKRTIKGTLTDSQLL